MPREIITRIPVVGTICLRLSNSKKLYLKTNGHDGIAQDLYWWGIDAYESDTVKLFVKLLKYSNIVFDIGASTGIYSLIAAIYNPSGKVYAFEPLPISFNHLKKNININRLHNVHIDSGAVTNYNGDIKLYIPPGVIPLDSSTLPGFRPVSEMISVRALTIDSFVNENNIPKIDLIKIDTEGNEYMILKGAKDVLKRDKPMIICEVLKGRTESFLNSILEDMGYKFFWITSKGLIEKKVVESHRNRNCLLIKKEKMPEIMKALENNERLDGTDKKDGL